MRKQHVLLLLSFHLILSPYCDATPASIMGRMFEMQELQEEVQ